MTLPHDIARCPGRIRNRTTGPIASALFPDNVRSRECVKCRRREPGHPDHQTHMEPPVFVGGKCPMRLEP